jgi:hypothetical protein
MKIITNSERRRLVSYMGYLIHSDNSIIDRNILEEIKDVIVHATTGLTEEQFNTLFKIKKKQSSMGSGFFEYSLESNISIKITAGEHCISFPNVTLKDFEKVIKEKMLLAVNMHLHDNEKKEDE